MRIAINGFGRIGRNFLRTILQDPRARHHIEVVTINIGPSTPTYVAHAFKYDTLMGTYTGDVRMDGSTLVIDDHRIEIIAEKDPQQIDWAARKIDWVVESSGHFTKREKALLHIEKAGAKHVLITAPASGDDVTIIPGINDAAYDASKDRIVSLGSCTTNALIPMLKVLDDAFGITHSTMTTIHAYTNTQVLLDMQDDDPRRSRAAALNMIPTSTGVTKTIKKVLPKLAELFDGIAIRVPIAKVSLIDLACTAEKDISPADVNQVLKQASETTLKNIMQFSTEPLVSSDYSNSPYSVSIDSALTMTQGNIIRVFGWYDNEWGYSERLKDFLMELK